MGLGFTVSLSSFSLFTSDDFLFTLALGIVVVVLACGNRRRLTVLRLALRDALS